MSSRAGRNVTARRAWLVALAGGALAAGSASTALGQNPDQVIDAGSNADQAAQALNEGCADMEKCDWKSDGNITTGFGPSKIIGDTMYNCSTSTEGEAEIGTGVSDTREETTSISESISLEISLGFLDLEKSSLEFKAFSSQSSSFGTTVKVTEATQVAAGYKGWNSASVRSGMVSGSAYITDGIKLIQVKGIELTFPGFRKNNAQQPIAYYSNTTPMTSDERETHCAHIPGASGSAARAASTAQARSAALKRRFKITVCRSKPDSARSSQRGRRRCSRRTVAGLKPPRTRRATATLTRAGRIYAVETNRRGAIRLHQRGTITPGRYRLIIRKKPKRIIVRTNKGKRMHWARHHSITTVPVTVRWTRGK